MFEIRTYGKSELAMLYFPNAVSPKNALRSLNNWFRINRNLRFLINANVKTYMPRHVRLIIHELGLPTENE